MYSPAGHGSTFKMKIMSRFGKHCRDFPTGLILYVIWNTSSVCKRVLRIFLSKPIVKMTFSPGTRTPLEGEVEKPKLSDASQSTSWSPVLLSVKVLFSKSRLKTTVSSECHRAAASNSSFGTNMSNFHGMDSAY
jgi:hypothetical protein